MNPTDHPFSNCMKLIEINDYILITPSEEGVSANLNWISYDPKSLKFQKKGSIDYPDYSDIKLSKPVSIPQKGGNIQGVVLVRKNSIEFISVEDAKLNSTSFSTNTDEIKAIIGSHPQKGLILFACKSATDNYILTLDIPTSSFNKKTLSSISGGLINGELIGSGLDTFLLLLNGDQGSLSISIINSKEVISEAKSDVASTSQKIGDYSDKYDVESTVAQLEEAPWHHFICCYTNEQRTGYITVAHLDHDNKIQITTSAIDTSFAKPSRFNFRLSAGPLWSQKDKEGDAQSAVVPIVIGYCGIYGTVEGCACLLLLEYDSDQRKLIQKSNYAVDTQNLSSFAANDLHIGAGIFSTAGVGVWGVLVAGIGTSFEDLQEGISSVKFVMVDLDQNNHIFPPLGKEPTKLAVQTVIKMKAETSIFGFKCDLSGQSVNLGLPRFMERKGKTQILAIIQAPPFEAALFERDLPSITITSHTETSSNININSNKSWQKSKDFGLHLSIGPFSIGRTINTMYGHGFDKMKDSSFSTSLSFSRQCTGQDQMIVLYFDYYVWVYTTYQGNTPVGEILVIFPQGPESNDVKYLECSDPDYGYIQKHEAGTLLSYVDSMEILKDLGYSPETLLVEKQGFSVDANSNNNLNYSKTNMISKSLSKTWSLHQSTNYSGNFNFSEDLFDFIPASFGLSISETDTYSDNEAKTTMVGYTQMIDIMISYPKINSEQDAFVVTPIIYQHKDMGCLMVAYQVETMSNHWQNYLPANPLKLMAVTPLAILNDNPSKIDLLNSFKSHSISFIKRGNQVEISVDIFNNSSIGIDKVVIDLYYGPGKPDYEPNGKGAHPNGWFYPFPENDKSLGLEPIASKQIPSLNALGRGRVKFLQPLNDMDYVCVYLYSKSWAPEKQEKGSVYWRRYEKDIFPG